MSFNLYTLVAGCLVGLAAGLVGRRRIERSLWGAVAATAAAGAAASVVALMFAFTTYGANFFAAVHVVYLIATTGAPLAAGLLIAGYQRSTSTSIVGPLVLGIPLLTLPVGLYATHVEPFWLRVDRVTLPADGPGPRIGILADLQTTSIGDYEQDAVRRLLDEEPDIVLIPGDLSQLPSSAFISPDERTRRIGEFRELLAELGSAVDHVVAVNGNTDSMSLLSEMAEGTGVVVLDNELLEIETAGVVVQITGISHEGNERQAEAALQQLLDTEASDLQILLGHKPDEIFRLSPGETVDLVVAGHTHGGQVALPFFGPPLTLSDVPRHVGAGGLHQMNGSRIYVSTGVGRERGRAPQIRFGVRPSIGIIDVGSGE